MKRWFLFALGLILIGLAVLWRLWLSDRWTERIPPGWEWKASFIGIQTPADAATGKFPEKDLPSVYDRAVEVQRPAEGSSAVILSDRYTTYDPATGKKLWEYIYRAPVAPRTGEHVTEAYRGDYFLFPRGIRRTTYRLHSNYLKGIPVTFKGEEVVEGVKTYLFTYEGRGEYTESYAGTADYPGIKVEAGQEIKCADDQFVFKAWVEPTAGETLKIEESCYTGDYVYDVASGKALYPTLRWAGVNSGDDLILRAAIIRRQRAQYLWAKWYIPAILLATGLASLGAGAIWVMKFNK